MASPSDSSVSVELGELLELLNALEAQDSRPLENFATLERLLAAGKAGPAESSSDDQYSEDHQYYEDHQSDVEVIVGTSEAEQQPSSDALTAQSEDWREPEQAAPDGEAAEARNENRLAVHIIQGLRKSIKDRIS